MSLRRITERPFVLGRCPGSDTRWRLHPSGSARGRRDPARSSRPATTKATWRSVDPEKRWVLPVHLPCLSRLRVVAGGGRGAGHRLISHPRSCQLPHCARMGEARLDAGAAGPSARRGRSHAVSPLFWDESDGEIRYQPGVAPLSKHCHLNHVAAGGGGGDLRQFPFQPKKSCAYFFCSDSLISLCSRVGSKNR